MSQTVFSKFYKYKDKEVGLSSDNDFLTMVNGTEVVKDTGEEYVKVDTNIFNKTSRHLWSKEESDDRFARLKFENNFTENNYFNKDIIVVGTTRSNALNVSGQTNLKTTNLTDLYSNNIKNSNTITSPNIACDTLVATEAINPSTNNTGTLGMTNTRWNTAYINEMYGIAQSARYSDLAEKYTTDKIYDEGTVVQVSSGSNQFEIFNGGTLGGVISYKPGLKINAEQIEGQYICLKGMVPVLCEGVITKGQYCIAINGGKVKGINKYEMTFEDSLDLVGIALEDSSDGKVLVKV